MLTDRIKIQSTYIKNRIIEREQDACQESAQSFSLPTLVLFFFSFSFVGWVWEVALHIVEDGMFINRGVFYGPWLPIYGTGGILILVVLKKLFAHPGLTFFSIMALCGIMEYATGWYLEKFLGAKWWDYSDMPLNIHGRVCFSGLLIFGIGGCLLVYVLAPALKRLFDHIPRQIQLALCIALVVLFTVDVAYSNFCEPNQGQGITYTQEAKLPESNF